MSDRLNSKRLNLVAVRKRIKEQSTSPSIEWTRALPTFGFLLTLLSVIYGLKTYYDSLQVQRKADLLFLYERLAPNITVENFELEFGGNFIAKLNYDVENHSAGTVRILSLPPRMYDCEGNQIAFLFQNGEWIEDNDQQYYLAPPTLKHPSDSAAFLPLASDGGSNVVNSITDVNIRDIRAIKFSRVVVIEFRFVAFSDLSWRFATEISEMESSGDPLPYGNDDFELADFISPVPPSSVTYSVPRPIMFSNGIASEAPQHVCRTAIRKVLGRDS